MFDYDDEECWVAMPIGVRRRATRILTAMTDAARAARAICDQWQRAGGGTIRIHDQQFSSKCSHC